jgi:type II secretory pathway pseudopilin PulG
MNKKGLTLIELIASIIIVFLLTSLVITNMVDVDKNTKQTDYDNLIKQIILAAEDYAGNHAQLLNTIYTSTYEVSTQDSCTCSSTNPNVSLKTLLDSGFIKGNNSNKTSLVDPRNNEVMDEAYYVSFCHSEDVLKTTLCSI